MAALIHLNGPACVGKSTLAAALVAERPFALNLDIDEIRTWLGGWSALPESKQVARDLGFAMTAQHLAAGHDVVMPQLIVRSDVIDHLAAIADANGAAMLEVVLIADPGELIGRLEAGSGAHPRDAFTADELRSQMEHALNNLPAIVAARPFARILDVSGMDFEHALAAVRSTLKIF